MFLQIFNKNSHNLWIVLGILTISLISCGGTDIEPQSTVGLTPDTQEQVRR